MKGFLLILLFFAFACGVVAQRKVSFGYDASGNRISRTLLLTRCAEEVCDTEAYHEEIADAYDVRIFPNSDGKRVRVIVSAITSGKVRGQSVSIRMAAYWLPCKKSATRVMT